MRLMSSGTSARASLRVRQTLQAVRSACGDDKKRAIADLDITAKTPSSWAKGPEQQTGPSKSR
jgi:hypothetical protein